MNFEIDKNLANFGQNLMMDLTSNEPFWLLKNGIITSYPSLKENTECDILIIGGGITGSLIAHQCIADGYDTVVVDRREIATGSTSATTAMLQYEIDVPLFEMCKMIGEEGALRAYKSCEQAIDRLEELSQEIDSKAGFTKKKSLYFTSVRRHAKWLRTEFECRKKNGFAVEWLSPKEIFERYQLENTFGGILSEQGASMDAFRFAHELLNFNAEKGLRIFDKTEVEDMKFENGYNIAELTSGPTIKCRKVIYCNGYESKELIGGSFVKLKSTYAIVSEIDQDKFVKQKDTLFWNTNSPYLYMRTTDDERLLVGGADISFKNDKARDLLLDKKKKEIEKELRVIFPHYRFYTDFTWAGTFGETRDGLPYIGEHRDFPNSFFVLGFGGNGITFSVTGMEMVSFFLQNRLHPLTEYFRFGR